MNQCIIKYDELDRVVFRYDSDSEILTHKDYIDSKNTIESITVNFKMFNTKNQYFLFQTESKDYEKKIGIGDLYIEVYERNGELTKTIRYNQKKKTIFKTFVNKNFIIEDYNGDTEINFCISDFALSKLNEINNYERKNRN